MSVSSVGAVTPSAYCKCDIRGCGRAATVRLTERVSSGRLKFVPRLRHFCDHHYKLKATATPAEPQP